MNCHFSLFNFTLAVLLNKCNCKKKKVNSMYFIKLLQKISEITHVKQLTRAKSSINAGGDDDDIHMPSS